MQSCWRVLPRIVEIRRDLWRLSRPSSLQIAQDHVQMTLNTSRVETPQSLEAACAGVQLALTVVCWFCLFV